MCSCILVCMYVCMYVCICFIRALISCMVNILYGQDTETELKLQLQALAGLASRHGHLYAALLPAKLWALDQELHSGFMTVVGVYHLIWLCAHHQVRVCMEWNLFYCACKKEISSLVVKRADVHFTV